MANSSYRAHIVSYDCVGSLIEAAGTAYEYDEYGNRLSMTYPDGKKYRE